MAYFVLLVWPFVALALSGWLGRERGFIWTMVVGYLLLPERTHIALPGLPDYDKYFALSLSAAAAAVIFRGKRSFGDDPASAVSTTVYGSRLGIVMFVLLGILTVASIMTVLTNPETLVNGPTVRPGLGFRDMVSMISGTIIDTVPLFLAMQLLRTPEHQQEVLKAIVFGGAFYAGLAAFEARMSPQLNVWFYGYFQHSWRQHLRNGFRPIVFLNHGITLGFFLLSVVLAAFAMFRRSKTGGARLLYLTLGIWVLFVLLISRNLGATMLAALFLPVVLFLPRFFQIRVVAACAVLFMAYPAVWQSQILPVDRFMEFVTSISEDRARSMQVRLDNEADVLARALEKPVYGWGGWSRWRIVDETGRDLTRSDGIWVRILGVRGWVGYICFFGMITLPMLLLARSMRKRQDKDVAVALALILAANLMYMIPNATLTPLTWMLAGTLVGYVRVLKQQRPKEPMVVRYSRFAPDHTRARVQRPERS